MKPVTGPDLCLLIEANGWSLKRINGSHHIYAKPGERKVISVPVHGNRNLKAGLRFESRGMQASPFSRRPGVTITNGDYPSMCNRRWRRPSALEENGSMIQNVTCNSAEELLRRLSELCEPSPKSGSCRDVWFFRGQADSKWDLNSSLERDPDLAPFWESEAVMLYQFRSKAHLYSDLLRSGLGTVDVLSIMQHHGAPTRLLDWTYSPYVAAFFAAADRLANPPETGSVWAVNQSKVRYWSNHVYQTQFMHSKQTGPDLDYEIEQREINFSSEEAFSALRLESNMAYVAGGFVVVVLPEIHNLRLTNQQGVFLANLKLHTPFQESLVQMLQNAEEPAIIKFEFSWHFRKPLLQRLMTANIHRATLFPDLGGLCSFVRDYRLLNPEGSVSRIRP